MQTKQSYCYVHRYALLKKKTKKLQSTGCHKKLECTRYMSSLQVKNLNKRFKEVSLESFTYLVVDGSTLTLDPVQYQDGDMLITSAAAKKGIFILWDLIM